MNRRFLIGILFLLTCLLTLAVPAVSALEGTARSSAAERIGRAIDELGEEATAVFDLNAGMFPESWMANFRLATAHMACGDRKNAEKNLKLVTERNPRFWLADFILADLDARIERVAAEYRADRSPGEQTGLTGPYLGQKEPGLAAEIFAPGIVSKALALNFSRAFSP